MIISHYNADWTLTGTPTNGVFANGEPWVISSPEVTAISPNNNATWDESYPGEPGPNSGSMRVVSPNSTQGYCTKEKSIPGYPNLPYTSSLDLSRTANLPFTLAAGEMLMTATGQTMTPVVRSAINEICVLTSLATAPAAGSFRPPLFDPTESREVLFNVSDVDVSFLPSLPSAGLDGVPDKAEILAMLPALPWFEFDNSWQQSSYGPANNFMSQKLGILYPSGQSCYGEEIADKWGEIALWLCLDHLEADKEEVMIGVVQAGLDIASFLMHGGEFGANGGHKVGRIWPVWAAANALKQISVSSPLTARGIYVQAMLDLMTETAPPKFSEIQTCFIVQGSDVGRAVNNGVDAQFIAGDVGLAEWGFSHYYSPQSDDRRWYQIDPTGVGYRLSTWPGACNSLLGIKLCGGGGDFGLGTNQDMFDYNERWVERYGALPGWFGQMWNAFYNLTLVQPPIIRIADAGTPRSTYKLDSSRLVTLEGVGFHDGFFYTLNGDAVTGTESATEFYITPGTTFTVSAAATIRAKAFKTGLDLSTETTATVTFTTGGKAAPPVNLTIS